MNRANGTIAVAATNYKPNSRLGWNALRLGKTSADGNLVDRIEVDFFVFVDVGEFGGVRVFFLEALDQKKDSGLCPRQLSALRGLAEGV